MSCVLKKYVANLLFRTKELENKLSGLSSLDYVVLDPQETLPTPSEETIGKIYLLLPDPNVETRYEYITIKKDDGTYEWEKLGSTDIDLTGYLNEDNFISSFDSTLQDDTHMMVSDTEKTNWNNKYNKPSTGIPKSDLDNNVQNSLNLADNSVLKILGKGLSTNDYTESDKDKLAAVPTPANIVTSTSVKTIQILTQAEFDAFTTYDANTEYNII